MDFLKKAKSAMKDVQDLQKGFKDMGFGGDKSKDQSTSSSTPAPSTTTASSVAAPTPGTTPAASERTPSVQLNALTVPHCTAEGAPTKIPLVGRKKLRDDYEAKKPELEKEFSKILGTPWTIYVDTLGVYTYMMNYGVDAVNNPGYFIWEYLDGGLGNLRQFKEKYGADAVKSINDYAPRHIITLEPTSDPSVKYNSTDFFEGRWRLLFRDVDFGVNIAGTGSTLGEVVNNASRSGTASGGAAGNAPAMSLKARKGIRDQYDTKIAETLATAEKYIKAPELVFVPNFETNYATLAAFKAQEDPDEKPQLRDDWEQTLGEATFEYFQGFTYQLDWQQFKGDEMMQEGFREAVDKMRVEFLVSDKVTRSYNDCVIEDGVLVMRTKPDQWWTNCNGACEKMSELL